MFINRSTGCTRWIRPITITAALGAITLSGPLGCAQTCLPVTREALTSDNGASRHDALRHLGECPCPLSASELGGLFDRLTDLGDRQIVLRTLGTMGTSEARTQLQHIAETATGTLATQARGYLKAPIAQK